MLLFAAKDILKSPECKGRPAFARYRFCQKTGLPRKSVIQRDTVLRYSRRMKHAIILFLGVSSPAFADPADIVDVRLRPEGDAWRVEVTLSHPDTGWDHYTDGWRIEDADGNVLGTRELLHPHVNEQPFLRTLSGVNIPDNVETVYIRARCSVDGWDFLTRRVAVPISR